MDLSRWDLLLWEQELDYEVRTLRLMTRFARDEHNRILCGDKSGRVTTFLLDGTPAPWKGQGDRPIGGPVYDLVVVHPLQDAATPLDLDRHRCLVVVGAGNGQLSFLDYLSGEAAVIEFDEESCGTHLDLGSNILSLLYIESCHELWVGLASGEVARLLLELGPDVARSRRLPSLDLGEAVSAFCFMPWSEDRSGDGYRQGWVCAATMLGNVYSIDPFASPPSVRERLLQTTGPIRTCVSLSRVASKHGWKCSDIFAVAYGGAVKYFIREWPEEGRPDTRETVLDWPCADRVFCLAWMDLEDAVWLVVGANDRRLHFCRVMSKKGLKEGRSPSHCFGDKRFSIRLPERVREVAVREVHVDAGGEAEANLYVALGNHQIRALRLLSQSRFRKRIKGHLRPQNLQDILKRLSEAPHDQLLQRHIIALLFRAGWLSKHLTRQRPDAAGKRRLRLIVYHLLAHSGPLTCREIQSGILDAANKCREFRGTAIELARHISKYCLDGFSFSDKTRNLDRLAHFNEKNRGDYLFDAAIYRSLLAERRHTERAIFELDEPVTSLQAAELYALGGRRLLATSYERGVAWLIEKGGRPRIRLQSFDGERPLEWLQRIIVWTDPSSRAQHAVFFYRHQGWTSCLLEETLEKEKKISLPPPRPVPGAESFFIYSFQELPGGVIAAGGRCADVRLLRITSGDSGRTIDLCTSEPLRATEEEYAPVWTLCFRPLDGDAGELLAGCHNGVCYSFPVAGETLGEPRPVYQPESPVGGAIRVLAPLGTDHLILGDATDSLALLRRLDSSFAPEWTARLGAAVTGAVQTTLWVPSDNELAPSPPPRRVFIVSDSLGKFHVVRPDLRQHSFAEPLVGSGLTPIEQMVLLPPDDEETEPRDEAQVAVACFDQTVRILRIVHRRESVRHLNDDLAQAVIATLREALPDLPAAALAEAERELRAALDKNLFVRDIVRTVVCKLAPANAWELALFEREVRGSFDEVAWKLASVNVRSDSTAVMSLRLRYDDPEAFDRLLDELDKLPSGVIKGPQGKRPHLRLRYLLRFAFKIVAHFLDGEERPDGPLKRQLARFVHLCHNLCQRWGSDQSDDELLCKLLVSHMFFRFATRRMLQCLLGDDDLAEELAEITGRSMAEFVQERLLNEPRLAISFRTVQHIRRMVDHDKSEDLNEPVKKSLVPLLVSRLRQCQGTPHDAWLGMELYLCLSCIEKKYHYSQWSLVSDLLENGLSLRLLDFLAERQRVIPPCDNRCQAVVEALSRAEGVSAGAPGVAEARRIIFNSLDGDQGRRGILAGVRFLTAVAITFDSSSDPDLRTQARIAIEQVHLEALSFPPSVSRDNMVQLLDCTLGLILLSTSLSSEDRRVLYRSLRESLEGLVALGLPSSSPEVGALDLDVVRKIFLEAREFVRRQVEIEFDFVAPLRFLQEHSFAGDEIADEQMLGEKLLSYADLQGDLSRAQTTLLLCRDATERVVVLNVLGERPSRETMRSRKQIRRRLETLLPASWKIDLFEDEAVRLLDFEPGTGGALRPDLFQLGPDLLGEIIPIDREGELYGLLFFAYPRDLAPDPSKRALARMVPQLLVMEFMRSVQTQRFLSLIFHHVSAPIAAMRVMLHSLTAGYIEPEERAKYFENLWYMAEDCRLMIENHQNYVRMARGMDLPTQPARFDITAEAEFRRKIVHYRHKGSQQNLRWASPPEALEVYLDRTMVGDIIQNLLDNACKYSPARSEIRLSLQGKRREVFIEVNDQGPGLPEEVSASLYGEGVRGEAAAHSTRPGLGLGLYMVRRYVERLNGDIWYDSSPRGTTFTVRLPREV